ncbi:MAG: hypothetical protein LQ345_005281 [Seirophora villosa]|nr:MAG: hypothetical protein LQ345_005281 [Seirophora villosa]
MQPTGGRESLARLQVPIPPPKRKREHKNEHRLVKKFSGHVEEARKHIKERAESELNTARDRLVAQIRTTSQEALGKMQKVDASTQDIARPLVNEVLELTRKDGTMFSSTLGKRISAYRHFVKREEEVLYGLCGRWSDLSRQIDDFASRYFGPGRVRSVVCAPATDDAGFETAEHQSLVAMLEQEKMRVLNIAAAAGERARKAVRANEKQLKLENQQRMQEIYDSMFDEGD